MSLECPGNPFYTLLYTCAKKDFAVRDLGGDRQGQYSIRINDKWRICFEWPDEEEHPFNIEIVDYH
jgi:plasmid maintenance system killer protein